MGVIFKKRKLSEFQTDYLLRLDSKFHIDFKDYDWDIFHTKSKNLIPLKELLEPYYVVFKYEDGKEYKGIPTGREYIDEFGYITSFQTVSKENHPGRLKYQADNDCILLSSLKGAITPSLNFDFDLSEYVFSNGFYIFKPKNGNNKKFLLHLLRTKRIKYLIDNVIYRGIGISAYREDDLLKLKIPKISIERQNEIAEKVTPIEQEIKTLKESKKDILDIINEVFGEEFNIELEKIEEIDQKKTFSISLSDTYKRNSNLRNSLRWNKIQEIQKELYSNISCINKLGNYIIETKNGWSPSSQEGGEGTLILGQEHFNYSGKLKISPSKATEETKSNISDFYIKNGDFFVSRGNTVDLVALASIVQEKIKENIIFPDLYIKITFKEKYINKEYIALLFNSFLGRYYFKYVSKGKNQTMVKISSKELNDFYLPVPTKEKQTEIVEKIKSRIDAQKNIDKQIEEKQNQISELIDNEIKGVN